MAPGPLRAAVVQEPLPDIPPNRAPTLYPDGIDLLDFDGSAAPPAAYPQQMLGNLVQPQRASGCVSARIRPVGARVIQKRLPVFGGQIIGRSQSGPRRHVLADDSRRLSICSTVARA
ncbi:hypothetical protein M2427_003033 [Bradyrhizobium sp. BR13661]|jgi:hypothetical protein|nr:hypothetical protein [Bradyrhizobium sp. BR13661]